MSDLRVFWQVLIRDPYLFLGLLSFFIPTVAYWRIYLCLQRVGFKYRKGLTLPAFWWGAYVREYARIRREYGWPAWPLHVAWLGFVAGIPLLLLGIFKL